MFCGVVFYSFAIGSLSSLLISQDQKDVKFDEKLNALREI